jgi:hypothetical protein
MRRWKKMSEEFEDFDAFCEKFNIQPGEYGAAFAAWLGGQGWDGDFGKVETG